MPETELPTGWFLTTSSGGRVNLRVSGSGRSFIAIIVLALAAYTAWNTAMRWPGLSSSSAQMRFAILAGFALLEIWCAFGDEVWCLQQLTQFISLRTGWRVGMR